MGQEDIDTDDITSSEGGDDSETDGANRPKTWGIFGRTFNDAGARKSSAQRQAQTASGRLMASCKANLQALEASNGGKRRRENDLAATLRDWGGALITPFHPLWSIRIHPHWPFSAPRGPQ